LSATPSASAGRPCAAQGIARAMLDSRRCAPAVPNPCSRLRDARDFPSHFAVRLDVAKLDLMLSFDRSQIGTGSSNSPRSTIQSVGFRIVRRIAQNRAHARDLRLRSDPENGSGGADRRKHGKSYPGSILLGPWMFARTSHWTRAVATLSTSRSSSSWGLRVDPVQVLEDHHQRLFEALADDD
jgi:hypothetical protein